MEINFKGPVMPIDPYSQLAFVEILNIILTAGHIVDVNRFLISRNVNPLFGSLSGYFRWSFAGDRFTLWQRTDYNSTLCFNHRILDLPFGILAANGLAGLTALAYRPHVYGTEKGKSLFRERFFCKFITTTGAKYSSRPIFFSTLGTISLLFYLLATKYTKLHSCRNFL